MEGSKKANNVFGLLGIVLCATCCMLPVLSVMLGAGTLAILSDYAKWTGVALTVLSLAFFILYLVGRRKSAPSRTGEWQKAAKSLGGIQK